MSAYNVYGTNLISSEVAGQKAYYLYNGHGDVTGLVSSSGAIIASYYYDAFGNIVEQSGNFSNPYRYSGYIYDEESRLYNLNARFYDASIARFMQEDTYLGNRRDPLSLNPYDREKAAAYGLEWGKKGILIMRILTHGLGLSHHF